LVLVICEESDRGVFWAADHLRSQGMPVEIVTGTDLAAAKRWEHRVGQAGVGFELELADGRHFSSLGIKGVLNRLPYLPAAWIQRVGGLDRDYAIQEMYAFYLSWLHSLPGPLLNSPTPQGLCGNWRHPSVWAALAGRAGLPTPTYRQSSDDDPDTFWKPATVPSPMTVFVVSENAIGPPMLPQQFRDPCVRLATAAGVALLGIDFTVSPAGEWWFAGASVMPDLYRGGEPLIAALAEAFAA
jgi:hypothetical protein